MKKKVIIISGIVLLIVIAAITTYNINVINIKKDGLEMFSTGITRINNYMKKFNTSEYGVVAVEANYKGAHGESFPANFEYNFALTNKDDKFVLELSNEEGYFTKEYDLKNIGLLRKNVDSKKLDEFISKLKNLKYKSSTSSITYEMTDIFNESFKTNYEKCTLVFSYKNLSLEEIFVTLDDTSITYNIVKNKISIVENSDVININLNDSGFSMNINDALKLNAFYKSDKDTFSIVVNNNVMYLELSDNLLFKTSTQAAIYNGLNMNITYSDTSSITKSDKLLEENSIPIMRYFNALDLNIWRN